jgi:type I restriction enzyme S subunit
MVALRTDSKKIIPRYLLFALQGRDVQHQIGFNEGTGSTVSNMRIPVLKGLDIPVPDLSNQKAIAHILGTLDDKIELNQKMNQNLEEIAKAIFKSWFVDFDPVRAKAEGRPTGLPPEISDLFPDELVDSEIGEIPKGWSVSTLGDLVTPKKGKSITKKKVVEGSVPVVAGGLSPAYYHNTSNVNAPTVTISASGANAGFARLYNEDIWASDCSYISEEQTPFVFLWYVFLKIHQEKIYHMQQGAAQPHIYPSDLMRLQLAYPKSDELWRCALDLIAPMFLRIGNADKESVVLSELRDTLLSKLISGELRIPDAEKFLEEAGI